MAIQLIKPVKSLGASGYRANMSTSFAVSLTVFGEIRGLRKPLVTYIAFQWLLLCVNPFMDRWTSSAYERCAKVRY